MIARRAAAVILAIASAATLLSSSPLAVGGHQERAPQPARVAPPLGPAVTVTLRAELVDHFTRVGVLEGDTRQDMPHTATFNITYNGFTPEAQAAFQHAVNIWSTLITSTVPIEVTANWIPLDSGILGSAGADYTTWNFSGAPLMNVRYPAALANKLAGSDLFTGNKDITASFNSTYANWYFGTDGNPPVGHFDFVSVVLHELGHGLGFFGSATVSSGSGSWGGSTGLPIVYDLFVQNGAGQSLLDTALFPNPSAALAAQLQSDDLFWNGAEARAANGGNRPRLYAPASWQQGSSYSHLNEATYPAGSVNSLMTPFFGSAEAIHSPGPITLGMFRDWGWTAVAPAIPGDFNGDGVADRAVFRPASGTWFIHGQASRQFGLPGDIPVPGDYNGDRTTDAAVYRPSTGQWFIQNQSTIQWGRAGDIPVPADFNGDGTTDAAFFRTVDTDTSSIGGTWHVQGQFVVSWGVRGDIPIAGDFDGDQKADLALYRPSTGNWHVLLSSTAYATTSTYQWGLVGDVPVRGDFDGDGRTDLAVFRASTGAWYLRFSSTTYSTSAVHALGLPGDVPMPFDVNGDGVDELTVFSPSDGMWFSYNRVTGATASQQWGMSGDIPVFQRPQLPVVPTSDFDGDRRSDVTVFRPSTGEWFRRLSSTNYTTFSTVQFGLDGDITVSGDYDGDRRADVAVYRPSTSYWFIRQSASGTMRTIQWGLTDDVPVPADYDGDGRTDIAVYRPSSGQWFVLRSSTDFTMFTVTQWGLSSDVPVPADYDGDGRADRAVYRPSTGQWFILPTTTAFGTSMVKQWGLPTDVPVPADFDGDGRADLVVYRPSSGQWLGVDVLTSHNPITRQWGLSSDTPVAHDYDGDGAIDAAVFRPAGGEWFIRFSSTPASSGAFLYLQWGLAADKPVAAKEEELEPRR